MCNRNYGIAAMAELQQIAANPSTTWQWRLARWWKRHLWMWRYRVGID